VTVRILALTKYGPRAASTRQRIMLYQPALEAAGMTIDYRPLLDDEHVARLSQGRRTSLPDLAQAYARRLRTLPRARDYDLLWIHYELFPFLPLVERLAGWTGRPYVVDYDDATFHTYDSAKRSIVRGLLGRKLQPLMRGAAAVVCGNAYLQAYAARFAARTEIIPTVVDTDLYLPRSSEEPLARPITIGWIGSPSTWSQVRPLLPTLERLCRSRAVRFLVVGAGAAAAGDAFAGLEHREWHEQEEVRDVQSMDIGIMPLIDLPFIRGKCGYKLIQYMACGLPVVASPIGVNAEIVASGEQGYLARDPADWEAALLRLIGDAERRARMGAAGRERAVELYSLASQAPRVVGLFKSLVPPRPD
jgi:glycosyltransferase involved in cell wall biosynthesis